MSTSAESATELADDIKLPKEDESEPFVAQRIFMNQVDTYHVKYIASFITDQHYGATKIIESVQDEAAGEEQMPEEVPKPEKDVVAVGEKYEIVGTVTEDTYRTKTEDISEVIFEQDETTYTNAVLKCGFVIFDITKDPREIPKALATLKAIENHIEEIKKIGPKTFHNYNIQRVFILLSTVMTWALTKPLSRNDPDIAFSEIDYKKRKAHPNYKDEIQCEREVVLAGRKFQDKLKTYVVCSGITYGHEEEDLAFLFKLAWYNEKYIPVFQGGSNYIPLIHIEDLTKVLHRLIDNPPTKPQFILAVEQTSTTLRQIVKALSKELGQGLFKDVFEEEAFLYKNFTQKIFDRCTVNLKMEPVFITENLQIMWKNDMNLYENMRNIVAEFRLANNLKPFKILLHGPPASGKTRLAMKICERYGTKYVSVKTMIEDTLEELRDQITAEKARLKAKEEKGAKETPEEEEDEEEIDEMAEEEEEGVDIEELEEQIKDIVVGMSQNEKLPDEVVVKLMRTFLAKNVCQNQGYILDGYPKTIQQTKELFGQAAESGGGEEEGAEDLGGMEGNANSKIIPEFVISLQATDEFLCERVMKLPERDIHDTRYNEENMLRRLAEFRENNNENNTMLNFFDESEIHPILIEVKDDETEEMEEILKFIFRILGEPIGFGLTPEEERALKALERENAKLQEERDRIQRQMMEEKASKDYQDKMETWTTTLEKLQMEEEKILTAQSEPLRNYLMKFIFPVLTKGLTEVVRVKPEDPVDFLAEYLFKENPEGKMFDPSYTRDGEQLLEKYQQEIEPTMETL